MSAVKQLFQVFVYGTLKKGEPNHFWLTSEGNGLAKFICDGKTATKFPLIVASKYNIPFLLNVPETGHNVSGEIYSVDEMMLANLDELEDYPKLYDRNVFNINGSDGNTYECWIYMLKQFPDDFLKSYEFRSEYRNSMEQPYRESNLDSCTPDDLYSSPQ